MMDDTEDSDGRADRRGRTLKTGKLWFNDFQSVIDCQVRDLTDQGARVRFQETFPCPEQVALYFPIDVYEGNLRYCETKWVKENEAGLHFTSEAQMVKFDEISSLSSKTR